LGRTQRLRAGRAAEAARGEMKPNPASDGAHFLHMTCPLPDSHRSPASRCRRIPRLNPDHPARAGTNAAPSRPSVSDARRKNKSAHHGHRRASSFLSPTNS
jgi:hypothetical protein